MRAIRTLFRWKPGSVRDDLQVVLDASTPDEVGFSAIERTMLRNILSLHERRIADVMAKILSRIESDDIRNIRLFAGDATELLAWLPDRSLDRIDLIHPDPWPKRRHWKRRFVQDATVAAMARVLSAGGEFRFVSDIDDYTAWTLAHFSRSSNFCWTAERASDWRNP